MIDDHDQIDDEQKELVSVPSLDEVNAVQTTAPKRKVFQTKPEVRRLMEIDNRALYPKVARYMGVEVVTGRKSFDEYKAVEEVLRADKANGHHLTAALEAGQTTEAKVWTATCNVLRDMRLNVIRGRICGFLTEQD